MATISNFPMMLLVPRLRSKVTAIHIASSCLAVFLLSADAMVHSTVMQWSKISISREPNLLVVDTLHKNAEFALVYKNI